MKKIPEINRRIREVVDNKANGSVNKFSKIVGMSQPRLNRLFNLDQRTNKYPSIPTELLIKITKVFIDINPTWLLTGKGELLLSNKDIDKNKRDSVEYQLEDKDRQIKILINQLAKKTEKQHA